MMTQLVSLYLFKEFWDKYFTILYCLRRKRKSGANEQNMYQVVAKEEFRTSLQRYIEDKWSNKYTEGPA